MRPSLTRLEEDGRDQGQGQWMSIETGGQTFPEVSIPLLPMLPSMAFPIHPPKHCFQEALTIGQDTMPRSGQGWLVSSDLGATPSLPHAGFHPCGLAPWEPPNHTQPVQEVHLLWEHGVLSLPSHPPQPEP